LKKPRITVREVRLKALPPEGAKLSSGYVVPCMGAGIVAASREDAEATVRELLRDGKPDAAS
jgi:hypothetical protein